MFNTNNIKLAEHLKHLKHLAHFEVFKMKIIIFRLNHTQATETDGQEGS